MGLFVVSRSLITVSFVVVVAIVFALGYYLGLMDYQPEEDPPYPPEGEVLVDETWEADSLIPPDTCSDTYTLRLKEGVSRLQIRYEVNLPFSGLNGSDIPPFNLSINFTPNFLLRLRGPDNEVVWNTTTNESETGTITLDATKGVWTLRLEVRGYGLELGEMEFRDDVHVIVTVF
jgi:hypothetical protein